MRWLVFILLLMPSLAAADKATRDNLLKEIEILNHCWPALSFVMPMMEQQFPNNFRQKFQLILQYEHDENLFSAENLNKFGQNFEAIFKKDLTRIRRKISSLPQSEQEYIDLKLSDYFTVQAPKKFKNDLKSMDEYAYRLNECIDRYDLND